MWFVKALFIVVFASLLSACINSSTVFSNRSVSHIYTPSIEGKSNQITEQPKVDKNTVEAGKDTKINASGTGEVSDNSNSEKSGEDAKK